MNELKTGKTVQETCWIAFFIASQERTLCEQSCWNSHLARNPGVEKTGAWGARLSVDFLRYISLRQ